MNNEQQYIYQLNYDFSKNLNNLPVIGEALFDFQKQLCDYVVRPFKSEELLPDCDAIDDVYHGLPPRTQDTINQR